MVYGDLLIPTAIFYLLKGDYTGKDFHGFCPCLDAPAPPPALCIHPVKRRCATIPILVFVGHRMGKVRRGAGSLKHKWLLLLVFVLLLLFFLFLLLLLRLLLSFPITITISICVIILVIILGSTCAISCARLATASRF